MESIREISGPANDFHAPPLGMSTLAQTSGSWSANVELCFQPNRGRGGRPPAGVPERAMVKRIAPIRVVSLILLAACGAVCQKPPPVDSLLGLRFGGSDSLQVQRQEMRIWASLPDAPSSVQPPAQAQRLHPFVKESGTPGSVGIGASAMRGTELGQVTPGPQFTFTDHYQMAFIQKEPSAFLRKYLYPSSLKQDARYYASTSDSFMGRASYAASRILVTRDASGKGRLNTRYFFGMLTSVALHTAYRPYRMRSTSDTFNNFGSTIGGDAGMNVFHEFGPGIRQMVKGLTPKFVSRIGERITPDPTRRDIISIPAR